MGLFFNRKAKEPQGKVVSVIDLKGAIMPGSGGGGPLGGGSAIINHDKLREAIDKAFAPPGLVAVALDINCPGGSPAQSEMIANHIRAKAIERGVPVYAFAQDVAASGGYWLACAADKIYAQGRTSIVGSIGVVSEYMAYHKLMNTVGVEHRVYTAGESKRRMGPFTPENDKDKAWMKSHLEDTHEMFKDWIKSRRGPQLAAGGADLDKEIFTGDIWHADKALKLGLIDGIGMMEPTLRNDLGKDFKLNYVTRQRGSLLSALFSRAAAPAPAASLDPAAIGEGIVEASLQAAKRESLWAPYNMR